MRTHGTIEVKGKTWNYSVIQTFMPEGGSSEGGLYSVFFSDPEDPDQWVRAGPPAARDVDVTEEKQLKQLFLSAEERAWRDSEGTYWRVGISRSVPLEHRGEEGEFSQWPDDTIHFRGEGDQNSYYARRPSLPRLGVLSDAELNQLLAKAKAETPG